MICDVAPNFLAADRDQLLLMPPSVAEWLPADHLAWFVLDVIDELDLAEFVAAYRADGRGGAAYDPAMMVTLLVYAYCVGERSSRRIQRRCVEDVAFRVVRPTTTLITPPSPGSGSPTKRRWRGCSAKCWACVSVPG